MRPAYLVGGVVLLTMAVACGSRYSDSFGVVTVASGTNVCFVQSNGKTQCLNDPALIARSGTQIVVGACVRLRLLPETSGTATLQAVAAKRCGK